MPKIVVSYRRSDSSATAGRIYDHLLSHFGAGSVFMDVDHIPFGTDFRTHIQSEMLRSDVLVAIIGPRWLGAGPDGQTRIADEADPVRVEVETALRHGITIVPVLVDATPMPTAAQLPEGLKALAFVNAAPVDMGRDFRAHMERLARSLDDILARKAGTPPSGLASPGEPAPPAHPAPPPAPPAPRSRAVPALAGVAALAVALGGGVAGWWVRAGPGASQATAIAPLAAAVQAPVEPVAAKGAEREPPPSARNDPAPPPGSAGAASTAGPKRGRAHGTFAWYELWTTDAPSAQRFYRSVVGWDGRTSGAGDLAYTLLQVGAVPVAGLATLPAATVAQGARPTWIGYVTVDDVDASTQEAKRLGATVYRAPADVPGIGRSALVADPQGALIVLFKGLVDTVPGPAPAAAGHPGWRELQAADRDAAFAFYARLFGWTKTEVPELAATGYSLFGTGPDTTGGITAKPADAPASAWLYYVQVDGLAAALARAEAAGGTISDPPRQVRGGLWVARGRDPQGAVFALMSGTR